MSTNPKADLSDVADKLRRRGQTLPPPGSSATDLQLGEFRLDDEDLPALGGEARSPMIEYALFRIDQQSRYCQ